MKAKKEFKKWFCGILGAVLLTAVAGLPKGAFALDIGGVEIHGYGHQGFLVSNENEYLDAGDDGTWNYTSMAIVFSSKVTDNTTIWIQLYGADEIGLDWTFVDYRFNNNLSVQLGQVKLPMGFYNETRDARFLQLSTLLPAMYRTEAELIHEAYRGIRAIYDLELGGAGSIIFEPIGGQLLDESMGHKQGQMFGGRITYQAPLEGLSLAGASTFSKIEKRSMQIEMPYGTGPGTVTVTTPMSKKGEMKMWYAGVDYVNYGLDLKTEYVWMKMFDETHSAYYAQAGYTFFDKLTPFVRYDYNSTDDDQSSDPSYYQKCASVGVGYKINYNVSLKAEYHISDGYAMPVASGEVSAGAGEDNWNMFVASMNFIF